MNNSYYLLVIALMLSACANHPRVSESHYSSDEAQVSYQTERCRVLDRRTVKIHYRDKEAAKKGEIIGAIAGAVIGGTAASKIGDGTGQIIAVETGAIAGAVAGGLIGRAIADQSNIVEGIEYSIKLESGEEQTFVQHLLEGDRIINVGETCRVQLAYGGATRVLPAEHIAEAINKPKQTEYID